MRPGTYVPTDPREIHAFAMEDLRVRLEQFSRNIALAEKAYEVLGTQYHKVPMTVRRIYNTHPHAVSVKLACEVRTREGDEADQVPIVLDNLKKLRECREEVKTALRNQDVALASQWLAPGERAVANVREYLLELQVKATQTWFSHTSLILEQTLPLLDGDEDEQEATCLRWVSALPEIVKALELGIYEDVEDAARVLFGIVDEDEFDESENEQDNEEDGEENNAEEFM